MDVEFRIDLCESLTFSFEDSRGFGRSKEEGVEQGRCGGVRVLVSVMMAVPVILPGLYLILRAILIR